jgi:hypothetical protein
VIVLIEGDVIFDYGALVRSPGSPLAEDAVESTVVRYGAFRADLCWVEFEVIASHHYILSLPAAVSDVRTGSDKPRVTAIFGGCHRWIDKRAVAGGRVRSGPAVPVSILPQNDATPIVNEPVIEDVDGCTIAVGYTVIATGFRDIDR